MNKNMLLCKVAGTSFDGRQEVIGAMIGDELALLRPEPNNQYDPNAIAVWVVFPAEANIESAQIGYLPREVAERVAPLLEGEDLLCSVDEIVGGFTLYNGGRANIGVVLRIELPNDNQISY